MSNTLVRMPHIDWTDVEQVILFCDALNEVAREGCESVVIFRAALGTYGIAHRSRYNASLIDNPDIHLIHG